MRTREEGVKCRREGREEGGEWCEVRVVASPRAGRTGEEYRRECPAHGEVYREGRRGSQREVRRGREEERQGQYSEERGGRECSLHGSPSPYPYALERASLLAREEGSRRGSLSSLLSEVSLTSGYASLPSSANARVSYASRNRRIIMLLF